MAVASPGRDVRPPVHESTAAGDPGDASRRDAENGMAGAFAQVRASSGADAPAPAELLLTDALKLLALWLPAPIPVETAIVPPEAIARDRGGRMAYKVGVQAARDLGMDAGSLRAHELMALGRQIVIDHVLSGDQDAMLVGLARLEGRVDEAAWSAGDKDKIAAQVTAYLKAEFKDEIDLYTAAQRLAAGRPLQGREALAHALLRQHGIDPDASMDGSDGKYAYQGVAAFTPALVFNWKAGDYYFNRDRLTADDILKMKMVGGARPTQAHIERMLAQLPDSLEAEFGRRFDTYKQNTAAMVAQWLGARLALHARDHALELGGADITLSRVKMRYLQRRRRLWVGTKAVDLLREERVAPGFLVSLRGAPGDHRCFVSSDTGTVHVLSATDSVASWLERDGHLVLDAAGQRADQDARQRQWIVRVQVEQMAAGPHGTSQEWLSGAFRTEIELGREAARSHTPAEQAVDVLLNLIPFRAMVVALQKGDTRTAIAMGALDVLSLIPLAGAGVRLAGSAARAAAPWIGVGARLGGITGRQGAKGLRHLVGQIPALQDRIKASLVGTAASAWGRLRPLDARRMATALRSTSPKLADILDNLAKGARPASIPDGVWRLRGAAAAKAGNDDAISAVRTVTAHNARRDQLVLLPYGNPGGTYTQVDVASGRRLGALLVADSGGWLYQTMPVASLERYRVASPDTVQRLNDARPGPDGTRVWGGAHFARLGADYVQVAADGAVSSAGRTIWRVIVPRGVVPDIVVHRLIYDADQGLWRQAEVPGLAGGQSRFRMPSLQRVAAARTDAQIGPTAAQMKNFRDALVSSMRGATPEQIDVLRALLDRIGMDPRGKAIMRAMAAHHQLLGHAPQISLREAANAAQPRPSLDLPVRSTTWHLDLESLRFGTTEAATQELAAVYNNMTGLLQNEDPFASILDIGAPALDPKLEQAWWTWLEQDPDRGPDGAWPGRGEYESFVTPRELTVNYLRTQLQEMHCYGGLLASTLKAVLKNETNRFHTRINLSRRGLDSVPPLPRDTEVLIVSHNPVREWGNLPDGLRSLHAEGVGMTELPTNLPAGLVNLNVSHNVLQNTSLVLPPGLTQLGIAGNGLTVWPRLPDTLVELLAHQNSFQTLPAHLPPGLQLLDVSRNGLTVLPADLPRGIQLLDVSVNALTELPRDLPPGLGELDVSSNRLNALPPLPGQLRVLQAGFNALEELPENLPRTLEMIVVSRNRLRLLPDDLPPRLQLLALQHNAIAQLPATILLLESCAIHVLGNPIRAADIPLIPPGRRGPRIFVSLAGGQAGEPVHAVRTVAHSVRHWLVGPYDEAAERWDLIGSGLDAQNQGAEFSWFLDRLRTTTSYGDAAFRADVAGWLVELSRPERRALRDDTLTICRGATETCEDRIVSTWNDMQTLRRNDDVRLGLYDERVDDVVDLARQMFRLDVLTDIGRRKERTLTAADELEVYLAYVTRLRDTLGLTTVAPGMHFYELSGVTSDDLVAARETVLAREREEFDKFLVLDYEPWQALLKRKDARAYAEAQEEAHRALDSRFEQRLREEVDKLGLDPADAEALADARKDLGPGIMREIRYSVLAPLTRALRAERPPAPAQ
jgi:hypothetical protein